MSREVEWDGRVYPSLAAAARAEGVAPRTMRLWLDLKPERPVSYPTPIRGTVYPSIAEAARQLGLTATVIRQAMLRGTLDNVGARKGLIP